MDLLQRFVNGGGTVCIGREWVLRDRYGCPSSYKDWAEVQAVLENTYDVPSERRLKAAGWVSCGNAWRKGDSPCVPLGATRAEMEAALDAITQEGLAALGVEDYCWCSPHGAKFILWRGNTHGWYIRQATASVPIYPPTEKLSVVKSWLEKLS